MLNQRNDMHEIKSYLVLLLVCAVSLRGWAEERTSLNICPWKVAPQGDVKEIGESISVPNYAADKWLAAKVPGTAFEAYISAGLVQDPNLGENVWKIERKKYDQNYWYRTAFTVPADYFKSGRIWLNLDGVHRDADVFVNGAKVGTMLGFFKRGRFDVTRLVSKEGKNALAVLAHIMEVPQAKGADGKWNFNVSSPSLLCSRGWDWMPRVPGLNTGIYKDVYLTHTGEVSIMDPWIRSALPQPTEAELSVQMDVVNSSSSALSGQLTGEINPGAMTFSKTVTLKPGERQTVTFKAADTPALHLSNPTLWWPNGYGDPSLYTCRLQLKIGATVSDQKTVTFGIKKYTYEVKDDILYFFINGKRLFLKGGSWGLPEYLMRNRSAADYDVRVRLHKEQNFNMIRNWLGSVPDEAFYAACDKYGIMVWDELWLNAHDGEPGDIPLYHANVIEKVKQFRNHPSIAFWVAMNEGTPVPEVNEPLAQIIKTYDGDDRHYQPCSNSGHLSGSGPWTNFDPPVYFRGTFNYTGIEKKTVKEAYGLRSELGTAACTSFDSFKKFIPKENWWPSNEIWNRHFLGPRARNAFPDNYVYKLGLHYGEASDIEDFCRKAQLLNLETMKAMFEGWLDRSDKTASGLIIWMSHPAYPCFVWQTYDYYYDTTGAYWGAKTACEPVHIFWNSSDDRIRVANTTRTPFEGLKAELTIFDMDGTEKARQTARVKAPIDSVTDCFKLAIPANLSPTHFLALKLRDGAQKIVSENFYWRGTTALDYFGLSSLKPVKLAVTVPTTEVFANGLTRMAVDISNPANSGTVAFAILPKLVKPRNGDRVLPVYMNDGYFSLVPGETKRMSMEYNTVEAGSEKPKIVVECWNNAPHPTPKKPAPLVQKEKTKGEVIRQTVVNRGE